MVSNVMKLDESKGNGRIIALWWLSWILGIASVEGQLLVLEHIKSVRLQNMLMAVLPVANALFPCIFPNLYFTGYPMIYTKRRDINRRVITLCIIILQLWGMTIYKPELRYVKVLPVLFFWIVLWVSVFVIFALCILPRWKEKKVMFRVGMWIAVWSFIAMDFLIVVGTHKEAVAYESGVVEEKLILGTEETEKYYIKVVKDDGTERKYKVTDELYSEVKKGEVVSCTRRKSVFGIQYDEVSRE